MCLYAQGFSMCDYLVKRSDRKTFLAFVGQGMRQGWDSAVQSFYGLRNVEDLEAAWLQHLRETRQQPTQPDVQAAQNTPKMQNQTTSRPIVRTTLPPVQPFDPAPVVRGAAPLPEQVGQRFGQSNPPPPPPVPAAFASGQPAMNWQPATVTPIPAAARPPQVQLLPPQFDR